MNQDLASYYHKRAKEYDKVYQIPEEQEDLLKATDLFQKIFANKSVLEMACGTGYWTERISKTATSVLATDINKTVIDIAKTRPFRKNVTFEVVDMYNLTASQKFDGLFGGFIWSHILIQELNSFTAKLKDLLVEGSEIVFMDSKQVEDTSHDKKRITRIDPYGNTYQTRYLQDDSTHEVLKNFPSNAFLYNTLSTVATNIKIIDLQHYWIATCNLKGI